MNLLVLLTIFVIQDVAFAANPKIKVHEATSKSLQIILHGSESLHSKLVAESSKRDRKKIKEDVSQIIQLVRLALKTAKDKEPPENLIHLERVLTSMESRLQDYLSVTESDMQKKMFFLREFYQHIQQIARQYDVSHSYNIFFCSRDKQKGTWIQKSTKALNPFDVDGSLKNCGTIVK